MKKNINTPIPGSQEETELKSLLYNGFRRVDKKALNKRIIELLDSGVDPNFMVSNYDSAIISAIKVHDISVISKMFEKGANLDYNNDKHCCFYYLLTRYISNYYEACDPFNHEDDLIPKIKYEVKLEAEKIIDILLSNGATGHLPHNVEHENNNVFYLFIDLEATYYNLRKEDLKEIEWIFDKMIDIGFDPRPAFELMNNNQENYSKDLYLLFQKYSSSILSNEILNNVSDIIDNKTNEYAGKSAGFKI